MMYRFKHIVVGILSMAFMLCVATHVSYAADPSVRVREDAQFTRLVFDWGETVSYSVDERPNDGFIITFTKDVGVDFNSVPKRGRVTNVSIESRSPLSVRVGTVSGASLRHFAIGSRVIADISGGQFQAVKPIEPEVKTAEKPAELSSQNSVPSTSPVVLKKTKTEMAKLDRLKNTLDQTFSSKSIKVETVGAIAVGDMAAQVVKELTDKKPQSVIKKAMDKDALLKPHKLTFSATTNIGMGAFFSNGRLWVVNDDVKSALPPNVTGPRADQYKRLKSHNYEYTKAYVYQISPDTLFQTLSSGLIWQFQIGGNSLSSDPDIQTAANQTPVRPERMNTVTQDDVNAGQLRGGSVLLPMESIRSVARLDHPDFKLPVYVALVENFKDFTAIPYEFVDFRILKSPVGVAIVPKVDDLNVRKVSGGIEISRPSGLAIMMQDPDVLQNSDMPNDDGLVASDAENRVFDFGNWQMGGVGKTEQNKTIILSSLGTLEKQDKIEGIVSLGKMYLSHAMWAEALGFLRFAEDVDPDLMENLEFQALHGAAMALGHKSDQAFQILSNERLTELDEVNIWRAFTLANLGDWQQASKVLPQSAYNIIESYPPRLAKTLALGIAEVTLRKGDVKNSQLILDLAEAYEDQFSTSNEAAFKYLSGELLRQEGEAEETMALWEPLANGPDDLYRVKAGLALSRLLLEDKKIEPENAINSLERLRYAWRGDELETQINYWLGKTYLDAQEYAKGLNIMREAAAFENSEFMRPRIAEDMSRTFKGLFSGATLDELSPIQALTVYEQFAELVPPGDEGNTIGQRLSKRLADADLLERAAAILQAQVDYRLSGTEIHRVGARLAALYLKSKKPNEALRALDRASQSYALAPDDYKSAQKKRQLDMMRAQALAQKGDIAGALDLLEGAGQTPDINRLRTDIAWAANAWDDAAAALADVILDSGISLTRPLEDDDRDLIMQYAVALNLGGDRIGLATVRERYGTAMQLTDKAKLFDVITRPRQNVGLASRAALLDEMNEVERFEGFLGDE